MNLILGIPSLLELGEVEQQCRFAVSLGLQFIELNLDLPQFQPDVLPVLKLKELAKHYELSFSLHLPENLDLALFQEESRSGNLQYLKNIFSWAAKSEIKVAVLHLPQGVHFSLPEGKVLLYDNFFERFQTNLLYSFESVSKAASAANVTICLENTGSWQQKCISRVLPELLKLPNIAVCYDLGHAMRGGNAGLLWNTYQSSIRHLHLHQAENGRDHLPIDSLSDGLRQCLQLAEERNLPAVIEVKTAEALRESEIFLRKYK